jgi:hypothetical protein
VRSTWDYTCKLEPSLYLDFAPGSPEALARALVRRANGA